MESSRLLDSAYDPYARRQTPSMPLSSSLSSGQAYYTVESLEGASSLPLLKSGFAPSASLPSERDTLLRLDAETRAWLSDRESLYARGRLLAAERESLLRRGLPAQSPADPQRLPYADSLPSVDARTSLDGLPLVDAHLLPADARLPPLDPRTRLDVLSPMDARARFDGLPPEDTRTRLLLDEFQTLDPRARVPPHGLDARQQDSLLPGLDNRARAQHAVDGLAMGAQDQRSLSELIRVRERAAGARSGALPYMPVTDSLHARRDIGASAMPLDSSLAWRGVTDHPNATALRPHIERPLPTITREPIAVRHVPTETARKQNIVTLNATASMDKSKTKLPPEQSEGWCAVCKIDCHNIKTLGIHLGGRKHRAAVEGNSVKVNGPTGEGKSAPATSQADKKRAIDAKPETSENAKRQKTAAVGNGASHIRAADLKKLKVEDPKKEKAKKPVPQNGKDNQSMPVCEVCNIFVTGQQNLELHLKGRRHAARVRELAGIS